MTARFVPHTIMGDRLFLSDHAAQPEQVVDRLLEVYAIVGHCRVTTKAELDAAIRASQGREGGVTVWIAKDLLDAAKKIAHQGGGER